MKRKKIFLIALVFALFQAAMPLLGWLCVHTIVDKFRIISPYIPWVAFLLLLYIGSGMLRDGLKKEDEETCGERLGITALIIQGIATSIDALSVGFTLAEYTAVLAFLAAFIIAAATFVICLGGVNIGMRFGNRLSNKSLIRGGGILIFIGIEILIKGLL